MESVIWTDFLAAGFLRRRLIKKRAQVTTLQKRNRETDVLMSLLQPCLDHLRQADAVRNFGTYSRRGLDLFPV
jgi:hypothetical protein